MSDCVHGVGHSPFCQILLQIAVRISVIVSPPCFISSAGTLSTPAALSFFSDWMILLLQLVEKVHVCVMAWSYPVILSTSCIVIALSAIVVRGSYAAGDWRPLCWLFCHAGVFAAALAHGVLAEPPCQGRFSFLKCFYHFPVKGAYHPQVRVVPGVLVVKG